VVAPAEAVPESPLDVPDRSVLLREFGEMTNSSAGSRREGVKLLARKYRMGTREMYQLLEKGPKE
jgi:hypothetical protein